MLEFKINEIEVTLANARMISEEDLDDSKVTVLSNVTIKNVKTQKEITYKLVSEAESDIRAKKISVNSPIGTGLLGKEVGDIAEVQTPRGVLQFEIMNISLG